MTGIGPQSTNIPDIFAEQKQEPNFTVDMSQNMWDYRNRGTFQGMPVGDQAKNLLVENAQQLNRALQPKGVAGVWTGYISPLDQDHKYLQEYTQLMQRESEGKVFFLQQNTQFCPSLNKFLVFITYLNIELDLNPRYSHLKEENNVEQ